MSGLLVTAGLVLASVLAEPQVKQVAEQAKKGDAVIVDVREADELADGMVTGALWLATSDVKNQTPRYREIMRRLPKDKTIYTYCAVGHRAGKFADALRAQGYHAENLGGFPSLAKDGFPVKEVKGATSQPCPYLCGTR